MSDAPPPAYEDATRPQKPDGSKLRTTHASSPSARLDVPRNGIPTLHRRSMEDLGRPLPPGWVRQFDPNESHQFFVDTNAKPPRSVWHHPYDDEQYLSTLSSEERERLEADTAATSKPDVAAASSADESENGEGSKRHARPRPTSTSSFSGPTDGLAPPRPERPNPQDRKGSTSAGGGLSKFGRKMKDKMTATTHEEREQARQRRAAEEQAAYEQYQHMRSAMTRAAQTGQPQLLGKNPEGQDVYLEPPRTDPYGNYIHPGGYGYGRPGAGDVNQSHNPYTAGPYANPNNRFVAYPRPDYEYGRPYGRGYGGGMGLPLAGGVLGGMMLGGLLF